MQNRLNLAIGLAREAGEWILEHQNKLGSLDVREKSPSDYVSEVDRGAELLIREAINKAFPDDGFLGEESGQFGSESDGQWVVDPLDGTTNFLRGIPHYAVSIAFVDQGGLRLGVVFDPVKNELFHAERGRGAHLNDVAISISKRQKLEGALLATGIPFNGKNLQNLSMFVQAMQGLLMQSTSGIRRLGAASLDLAYVACGRFDGFWEAGLKPWDIAAGALLVQEAGGVVSDFNEKSDILESGNVIAANTEILSFMQKIVRDSYKDD